MPIPIISMTFSLPLFCVGKVLCIWYIYFSSLPSLPLLFILLLLLILFVILASHFPLSAYTSPSPPSHPSPFSSLHSILRLINMFSNPFPFNTIPTIPCYDLNSRAPTNSLLNNSYSKAFIFVYIFIYLSYLPSLLPYHSLPIPSTPSHPIPPQKSPLFNAG